MTKYRKIKKKTVLYVYIKELVVDFQFYQSKHCCFEKSSRHIERRATNYFIIYSSFGCCSGQQLA